LWDEREKEIQKMLEERELHYLKILEEIKDVVSLKHWMANMEWAEK